MFNQGWHWLYKMDQAESGQTPAVAHTNRASPSVENIIIIKSSLPGLNKH